MGQSLSAGQGNYIITLLHNYIFISSLNGVKYETTLIGIQKELHYFLIKLLHDYIIISSHYGERHGTELIIISVTNGFHDFIKLIVTQLSVLTLDHVTLWCKA